MITLILILFENFYIHIFCILVLKPTVIWQTRKKQGQREYDFLSSERAD